MHLQYEKLVEGVHWLKETYLLAPCLSALCLSDSRLGTVRLDLGQCLSEHCPVCLDPGCKHVWHKLSHQLVQHVASNMPRQPSRQSAETLGTPLVVFDHGLPDFFYM